MVGIFDVERVYGSDGIDDEVAVGRFAGGANRWDWVILGADQNDSALFAGELEGFEMHLGDEGASCINQAKRTVTGLLANGGGNAMGTEGPGRNWTYFFNGFRRKWRRGGGVVPRRRCWGRWALMHIDGAP